ncbi:MAG TPA: FAD-dependent oxidoreductase [Candidatus Sulfotelmatobacter sp.]|nr:FAD-dependent oxidoreductase [Candidatus Sulfotelmatobacter sp.]
MSIFSRREFLKLAAMASATLPSLRFQQPAFHMPKIQRRGAPKKVTVVGAGLAGLAAAYELTQAGHEVTILEAQTRPGGRALTWREPFSDGLYAEAGAARFFSTHQFTMQYCKLFGLTLDPFYPEKLAQVEFFRGKRSVIAAHGKSGPPLAAYGFDLPADEQKLSYNDLWRRYAFPHAMFNEIDASHATAPDWPPQSLKKYDVSLSGFLRAEGASPGAIGIITDTASSEVSVLWLLRVFSLMGGSQLLKIRGGTDLLPSAFAARLKDKIYYGAPVVRIEQDRQKVQAVFMQSGSPQKIVGDYLLCTLPCSVLRRVEFSPPLPANRAKAIREIDSAPLTRVFLQSRKRYWEEQGFNGFGDSDALTEIWQPTFDQPGPRGILVAYFEGRQVAQVDAMDDGERIRYTLQNMERIFPGIAANCEGSATKVWAHDEWAKGGEAVYKAGQVIEFLPYVGRPVGRVHFAGEHTSPWGGWMNGALESGVRVAREISEIP